MNKNNIDVKIIKYLANPPTAEELKNISRKLAISPMDFIRKKESEFPDLGINNYDSSDSELCEIMSENPKLIERPIVVKGDKAIIGRPPENVLELF